MDVRPITAVEEVTELADDVQIPVIDNGTLKRISKSNAKFGGGGITTFTLVPSGVSTQMSGATSFDGTVLNENGEEVTVEEAIAAFKNGIVEFSIAGDSVIREIAGSASYTDTGIKFYTLYNGALYKLVHIDSIEIGTVNPK